MKIAVECKSPLLQKSLELFLDQYLCSLKQCDIVIRDTECMDDKRCFYVSSDKSSDLIKPFSKSQLILALEKRYKSMKKEIKNEPIGNYMSFDILERRIESLTAEYQANLLKVIKAFYEN
ncbi:hypothetical protein [Sulfurimonas sp.]|uniref:hypothetical protein n=1 Tax=Sulfurimonas sp. TaxID=2022749 RepID=UPI0025FF0F4C|nr:hypothetical protein [Sulfurimonas sp.]MDD5158391.1 hypothetical protein [Sulfurimonas sp.]